MKLRACVFCWALFAAPSSAAPEIIDLAAYPDALRVQSRRLRDGLGTEIVSCDVNGDGIRDVLLSAAIADGLDLSRQSAGEVDVILGARKRWAGVYSVQVLSNTRIIGQEEFDSFGAGLACADFNGDGYADIAGGADGADGPLNGRDQAGQVHIVFGNDNLPLFIDLLQSTGTTIFGAQSPDGLGAELAIGDLDGDGSADLLFDASHGTYAPTNQTQAGKVHVLFARSVWPPSIDLLTESDLTLHGATKSDNFGGHLAAGDLDLDGIDELIVAAPGSDRPGTTRNSSGSVYVWRGRTAWPATIDVGTSLPDSLILGADAGDGFGRAALAVSDWDVDGTPDLLIGGPLADGPNNTELTVGEMRSVEPGPTWPSVLDLRTDHSRVLYGLDPFDFWFNRFQVGDVNGDDTPDLISSGPDADGPGESREFAGECITVFGRSGLPFDLRLANGDHDLMIYGAQLQDGITSSRFTTDINDDGIEEIAIRGNYSVPGRLSDVWLVSPVDSDGDGYTQLADNCPLVANADQLDTDGDQRGDACALDWDGDAVLDEADCAPSRRGAGRPPSIGPLLLTQLVAPATTELTWPIAPSADRYDVSRGAIGTLAVGAYGICLSAGDPDPTDRAFRDDQSPPPAEAFYYLVRGVDLGCGGPGSWGTDSAGTERVNLDPAACP